MEKYATYKLYKDLKTGTVYHVPLTKDNSEELKKIAELGDLIEIPNEEDLTNIVVRFI